jgi:hypothetical protein
MSVSTPPVPRKRGLGCFGIGCLILALVGLLVVIILGSAYYAIHKEIIAVTSDTPPAVPPFTGSDDLYERTKQKVSDFDHDLENHQAATIRLNSDEINVLISRDPNATKNQIHAFVTLANNDGRVQASGPTGVLTHGWIRDRYFNVDASFQVHFESDLRMVHLIPNSLQLGDKDSTGTTLNSAQVNAFVPMIDQTLNDALRGNSDGRALLNQAKSIDIEDGELVIQTQ